MKLPLLLLLLVAVGAAARSPGWSPTTFPNPFTNPLACNRDVRSWVCDPDAVLSPYSRDVVEGIIKSISLGTQPFVLRSCGSAGDVGPQVAVAIMRSFDFRLLQYQDEETVAANFARKLQDMWGVGHVQCQDGVLLLLSLDDRQVYISRGSGAARYLRDHVLDRIINSMKPLLRSNRYNEAVESAVMDIGLALSAEAPQAGSNFAGQVITVVILGGFGFLVYFMIRSSMKEHRRYADCRAKLEKLKRDQALLQSGQAYNPTSCPICLEDFQSPAPAAASAQAQTSAGRSVPEVLVDDDVDGRPPPLVNDDVDGRPPPDAPSRQPLLGLQQRLRAMGVSGAAAPAAAAGAGASGASRRPLMLPCMHQFCEACISEWVAQRKTSCPVCRKPIDESPGDSRDAPPPPPCYQGAAARDEAHYDTFTRAYRGPYQGYYDPRYRQRGYNRQDLLRDELLFRLLTMRRRYPQYITNEFVHQWSDDVVAGREVSSSTWSSFQRRDPAIRAEMAQSGSRGASSGFSGGKSSGGRGGSW